MQRAAALTVGLGAAAGAGTRWGVGELMASNVGGVPWALLVANTTACGLLGVIIGSGRPTEKRRRSGASVGFCGGLSTMSTLAVEVAAGLRGDPGATSVPASVGLLVASLTIGAIAYGAARARTRTQGRP